MRISSVIIAFVLTVNIAHATPVVVTSPVPPPDTSTDNGPSLAAIINDTSNPYWKAFEDGLRETAHKQNVTLSVYTLQNSSDSEGQLNKCETALLKKPRAILFAAVNGMNLATCLRKANSDGIILVDVDGNVDEALATRMGVSVAFSVASNNYDLGAKAATYINGLQGEVLIIEGLSGSQPSELRVKGFKENLGDGLTIVASQPGSWDRVKAADVASRTLLKNPSLSVIFAANDTMALGAVEALRANGNNNTKVIGVDGTSDAVRAIKEGRLTASIAQLPYLMAKEAIEKTIGYIRNGNRFPFNQFVPILALDRVILESKQDPMLNYLR